MRGEPNVYCEARYTCKKEIINSIPNKLAANIKGKYSHPYNLHCP